MKFNKLNTLYFLFGWEIITMLLIAFNYIDNLIGLLVQFNIGIIYSLFIGIFTGDTS